MKFTPIILIIASILIFFFYIDPAYREIQVDRDYQDELNKSLGQAQDLEELRRQKVSLYDAFDSKDKDRVGIMISDTSDETRLFNNIAGIGSRNGVSITQVRLETDSSTPQRGENQEVTAGPVKPVSVGFTASTRYQNFISFLEDIERSLQVMDVNGFKITSSELEGGVYKYEVDLTAYSL